MGSFLLVTSTMQHSVGIVSHAWAGWSRSVSYDADGSGGVSRSSAGMKLSERSSAPAPLPMRHLGSEPFASHMPLPDRDTEM